MFISYNEACARDCSTLEQDLVLCEKAGFDYIEIRLDMLTDYLKRHTVEELAAFFCTSRLKPHAFNALYLYPEFLRATTKHVKRRFWRSSGLVVRWGEPSAAITLSLCRRFSATRQAARIQAAGKTHFRIVCVSSRSFPGGRNHMI